MSISLEQYSGLIFDMDGTLLDTMPTHVEAWQETAHHFGFPFDGEWLHSLGGMPSPKIAAEVSKKYGIPLDCQEVSQFKMASFANANTLATPIPVTLDLLTKAQGKFKTAIGTGSQRESAIKLLTKNKLMPLLDAVVSATDVENHKPNPDTFLLAAEKIGLAPSQCVVFEDTELGKQAAHAAGMDCIMVKDNQLTFHPHKD